MGQITRVSKTLDFKTLLLLSFSPGTLSAYRHSYSIQDSGPCRIQATKKGCHRIYRSILLGRRIPLAPVFCGDVGRRVRHLHWKQAAVFPADAIATGRGHRYHHYLSSYCYEIGRFRNSGHTRICYDLQGRKKRPLFEGLKQTSDTMRCFSFCYSTFSCKRGHYTI